MKKQFLQKALIISLFFSFFPLTLFAKDKLGITFEAFPTSRVGLGPGDVTITAKIINPHSLMNPVNCVTETNPGGPSWGDPGLGDFNQKKIIATTTTFIAHCRDQKGESDPVTGSITITVTPVPPKPASGTGGSGSTGSAPATNTQVPGSYTLIQPLPFVSTSPTLSEYLEGMMKLLIALAGVIAVIRIVICGITRIMATESTSARTESSHCILMAIGGLVLAIASWTILNTLNPFLLSNDLNIVNTGTAPIVAPKEKQASDDAQPTAPGWYYRYKGNTDSLVHNSEMWPTAEVCAQRQEAAKTATTINKECFEVRGATPTTGPVAATIAGEDATRQALCKNTSCVGSKPIGINRGSCVAPQTTNCTDVAGLPSNVVDAIIGIQSACGCNVLITGGTEHGINPATGKPIHASHGPGKPAFDLQWNGDDALAKIIKSQGTPKPSFSGNQRWKYNGFWYTDEKSSPDRHWHVCIEGAKGVACAPAKESSGSSSSGSSANKSTAPSTNDSPISNLDFGTAF